MMVERVKRRRNATAIALSCAVAALALPCAASADRDFRPNRFPVPLSKPGEVLPSPLLPEEALTGFETPAKSFQDACGLAVDSGNQIYVADHDHDVIDIFSPGGRYVGKVKDSDPLAGPCGLAAGAAGALFVNEYHHSVIRHQAGSTTTFDDGPATGVAVDASAQVYVTHKAYVAVYEPDGSPAMNGSEELRIGVGALDEAFGVAVSNVAPTAGYVYVADASTDTVKVFDPAADPGAPVEVIDAALGPQQGFQNLRDASLAIDPTNGNLLVTDQLVEHAEEPPVVIDEFTPTGNFRGQLPHAISGGEPVGIAVTPTGGEVFVTTGRRQNSGVYAFGPTTASHPLLVTKAGAGQGTVVSNPVGINCPAGCAAGEAEFKSGSTVTLSADAQTHSAFAGWTVTGQPEACPGSGPCQVQMDGGTEVVASFEPIPQQIVTVVKQGDGKGRVSTAPEGIDCGEVCSAGFDDGSTVVLTAAASLHSHFAGWFVAGDPGLCAGTGPCEVAVDQAAEVKATFLRNPAAALSVAVSGAGRVSSLPRGVACPPACGGSFPEGETVSLVAEPAPGFELLTWSGACTGKRGCTVEMTPNQAVGATFVPIEDALAVSVTGAGTGTVKGAAGAIDCGLVCAGIFKHGAVVTLAAEAEPGSRFVGFAGCDTEKAGTCTVTVNEAKTVTAVFAEAPEISVKRVSVRGKRAALTVQVPAPGLLTAKAKGIVGSSVRARSDGPVVLNVSLGARGQRALRRADEGRISVDVHLSFSSSDGSKAKARKIVTFRRRGGRS